MLKKTLFFLVTLFLIIAGLIGYQWFLYNYSDQAQNPVQLEPLTYNFTVTHKDNNLYIEHKIQNMVQEEYDVSFPNNISDLSCQYPDESECEINNEGNQNVFRTNGNQSVTLMYQQFIDSNRSNFYEDWFIQFLSSELEPLIANIEVKLSEEMNMDTTWVAGAFEEANIQREHLRYFAWQKESTTDLPMYMAPYVLEKDPNFNSNVSFYKQPSSSINFNTEWVSVLPERAGLTIVNSNEDQTYTAPLLVIGKESLNNRELAELALTTFLLNRKPPSESINWMWAAFPSLILDYDTGEGKANKISKELLTLDEGVKEELYKWFMEQSSERVTAAEIDEKLSSLMGYRTTFFSENEIKSDPFVPLYFFDQRQIIINDEKKINEWQAVYRQNELFIPINHLSEEFGFEMIEVSSGAYFLTKGNNSLRFYKNEDYFIYNEENYGLTSTPIKQFGDKVYMTENFIENFLDIEVIKRNDGIYLRSLEN